MFETSEEIAQNKLILLYLLKNINIAMTNSEICQFALEKRIMDYFAVQSCMEELFETRDGETTDPDDSGDDDVEIDPNYPRSKDDTNIENIRVKWITADTVDNGVDRLLYIKPEGDEDYSVRLQINYALSKDGNLYGKVELNGKNIIISISNDAKSQLVKNKIGIGISPRFFEDTKEVKAVAIKDAYTWDVYAAYRTDSADADLAKRFLEYVKE